MYVCTYVHTFVTIVCVFLSSLVVPSPPVLEEVQSLLVPLQTMPWAAALLCCSPVSAQSCCLRDENSAAAVSLQNLASVLARAGYLENATELVHLALQVSGVCVCVCVMLLNLMLPCPGCSQSVHLSLHNGSHHVHEGESEVRDGEGRKWEVLNAPLFRRLYCAPQYAFRQSQPLGGLSMCLDLYNREVFMGGRGRGVATWVMGHLEQTSQFIWQWQTFHSLFGSYKLF